MSKKVKKGFKAPNVKTPEMKVKKKVTLELLYMSPQVIHVTDLNKVLALNSKIQVHVWDQLDILEITLPSGETVDFETMTAFMNDEEDLMFMAEKDVKTVYAVTIEEEAMDEFKPVMKEIIQAYEGFLCSDSDDFMPMYTI